MTQLEQARAFRRKAREFETQAARLQHRVWRASFNDVNYEALRSDAWALDAAAHSLRNAADTLDELRWARTYLKTDVPKARRAIKRANQIIARLQTADPLRTRAKVRK